MHKRILTGTVFVGGEATVLTLSPGINLLWGQASEEILLTLAGIFGGIPAKAFKAEIKWREGVTFFVYGEDGRVLVNDVNNRQGAPAQLIKGFHKHRFLNFRNNGHILDGSRLPAGSSSASDLLLEKLRETLVKQDDRPLFICNFLERLDEAVDL